MSEPEDPPWQAGFLFSGTILPAEREVYSTMLTVFCVVCIVLLMWIVNEVGSVGKRAGKAIDTANQIKEEIAGLRSDLAKLRSALLRDSPPSPPSLANNSHYIAVERQKERTRQFLEEWERRKSANKGAAHN